MKLVSKVRSPDYLDPGLLLSKAVRTFRLVKHLQGELRAPEGATVVTPLTTIVDAVVQKAVASGGAPVSAAEAQAQVAKGLGLSEGADLMATDFVATGSCRYEQSRCAGSET
jgi:hypothetical protein